MNLNGIFPLTRRVGRDDVRTLLVVVILYLVVCGAVRIAGWLLGWIPLIGSILGVLFWLIGAYCTVGIILAVLAYFRGEQAE